MRAVRHAGWIILLIISLSRFSPAQAPKPLGKLVDLDGHRLHVDCEGRGSPTVVIENGLGDFSFDWILVQRETAKFTRVCTYDRGGYAWSDPGPLPRTYAQLNLELHDALAKLNEKGPFLLVGHSFGGPLVRKFAASYPRESAGMVLVDAANEEQRYVYAGKAILLRDGAHGKAIPLPHEQMRASDRVASRPNRKLGPLDPLYAPLPKADQALQSWAESLSALDSAEDNQREWSPEDLTIMHNTPQAGTLGAIPLIVLTRAKGGYGDNLDIPAAQLEKERLDGQAKLATLSTNARQIIVNSGHNMELEAPDQVSGAIRDVCAAVRNHSRI